MKRAFILLLAWIIALLGGFFAVAGAKLALIGGSPYYLVTGILMIVSGALIGRRDRRGVWLFAGIWLGTLAWTLWEVGFSWLQWVPRMLAPSVLLAIVLVAAWTMRDKRGPGRRHAGPALAAGLLVSVLAGLLHSPNGFAQRDVATVAGDGAPGDANGDWRQYGGTLKGQRYSSLNQIDRANVDQLELAWVQRTGDLPDYAEKVEHKREYHSEATPIHIGDTLYTCTPHSWVEAIDATTGKTKWVWKDQAPLKGNSYLVCRGVSYFEAPAGTPCPRRIFAPTFDARMVALDADTGKLCPGFGTGGAINLRDHMGASPRAYQISTSPPIVANGRLIVGERVIDNEAHDEPSGVVRAYDPVTGAPIWAWDPGSGPDAIAPLTGDRIYTRGTPNVWGAMTADEENGIVYLGTGNATPDYWIGKRSEADNRYGSSIVALDIATGKLRWMRQLVRYDKWDMDIPVGPSLFDYRAPGGGMVPALIQTTKMGQVYFLNRLTGEPLAPISDKMVSDGKPVLGQPYSKTQPFSTGMPSFTPPRPTEKATWGATPIDHLVCRIQYREARDAGIYPQLGREWVIGHPAFDGVTDWGGGAVDPVNGIFTVNTMEMPFRIRLAPRDAPDVVKLRQERRSGGGENARAKILYEQRGTPYVALVQAWIGPFGAPCIAPPWGHLSAVDLSSKQLAWRKMFGTARDTGLFGSHLGVPVTTGTPNLGGSIITAGGLVFIGATTDQYLRAYDERTGAMLWKARLPAGAQATPMTYMGKDGRQYVVITAGGHGALGTRYGDYTMAFALPKQR
tara:strand:+ start:496 stop:2871 length:2376 start_codon:yes stop_codon:yes gene_type:complete